MVGFNRRPVPRVSTVLSYCRGKKHRTNPVLPRRFRAPRAVGGGQRQEGAVIVDHICMEHYRGLERVVV